MFKNTIIFLNGSLKTLFINVKKKLYLCRLINPCSRSYYFSSLKRFTPRTGKSVST